ncbi:MAG: pilus assembly protein TadG-related protein [Proteobacteria bacterium]|nr:pilus assembly protein TadG-related protein [Pseudomonadota bacterium]
MLELLRFGNLISGVHLYMNMVLTVVLESCWRFSRDIKGSAAPIFLLVFTVILGTSAFLLDVSRVLAVQSKLNSASELAVVAMAKNLHFLNDQQLNDFGLGILSANLKSGNSFSGSYRTVQDLTIKVETNENSGEVTIEAQTKVTTYFLKIFHFFDDVTVSATLSVRQVMPEAEIVLALDSSAEMEISGRLEDVKSWTSELVQAFVKHSKIIDGIQFSLVPFGGSYVNVAPHKDWVDEGTWPDDVPPNVPGTKSWAGELEQERWCVGRRSGIAGETDLTPEQSKFPLVIGISSVVDVNTGLPHYSVTTAEDCPLQPILPLTDSSVVVSRGISKIIGTGEVMVGQGMVWAERVLSPNWLSSWQQGGRHPVAYNDPEVEKIVLLFVGSQSGSSEDQTQLMSAVCTRLKSEGVKIYVIDYQSSSNLTSPLTLCATSSGYYFNVTSSTELREVIWQIARFLTIVKTGS